MPGQVRKKKYRKENNMQRVTYSDSLDGLTETGNLREESRGLSR